MQEFFSPDIFFVLAFIGMLAVGRAWQFAWDWAPAILLILGYDYLRGLVPKISGKVHVHAMIYFDRFLFFGTCQPRCCRRGCTRLATFTGTT